MQSLSSNILMTPSPVSDADDVSLVAVIAMLGQVHDPVMVIVALGPVHNDLLRAAPVPHNNALKFVIYHHVHRFTLNVQITVPVS